MHAVKKSKDDALASASGVHKFKVSSFPVSLLKIGSWEHNPRNGVSLFAVFYYGRKQLVWEFHDGNCKKKIEINWIDIQAMKAKCPWDAIGTLDIVLAKPPGLSIEKINPQPRRNTQWLHTPDFTDGQAISYRRHYLECPPQQLRKHIEKLQQSDPRLNELLSKEEDIMLYSPNFGSGIPESHEQNENKNKEIPSSFGAQSVPIETLSPSQGYEYTPPVEYVKKGGIERPKDLITLDQIRAMSMTDLLSYLEERVSGQDLIKAISMTDDLVTDKIRRQLLTDDTDDSPAPDDKALMSYVNSLSCLLQQDTNNQSKNDDDGKSSGFGGSEGGKESDADICGFNKLWAMSRKDSFGVSLLNLPRMASLPQFLFKISEDFESES